MAERSHSLDERDDKAAQEEARQRQMEADLKALNEKKQQEAAEAAQRAEEEAARQAKMEAELKALNEKKAQEAAEEAARQRAAEEAARAAATIKHVWTSEDTYASLAQRYYGSFKEPYWRLIYEHNKAIIGNHPNAIRVGLEIEIPPLPDELKPKQ